LVGKVGAGVIEHAKVGRFDVDGVGLGFHGAIVPKIR
jgi:hypothetical protein